MPVFVINLDRDPERLRILNKTNPHLDHIRFSALDGREADRVALLEVSVPLVRRFIHFEGFGIGIPNNGIDCMTNTALPNLKAYVRMPPLLVSENRLDMSHPYLPR